MLISIKISCFKFEDTNFVELDSVVLRKINYNAGQTGSALYMYRWSYSYINWCWVNIRLCVAGHNFPTVSWAYCSRMLPWDRGAHCIPLHLTYSHLRRNIDLDHAHNGVTLTQDNYCDWCIFLTSQNITRHLSFKTEYHASVTLYGLHGYNR